MSDEPCPCCQNYAGSSRVGGCLCLTTLARLETAEVRVRELEARISEMTTVLEQIRDDKVIGGGAVRMLVGRVLALTPDAEPGQGAKGGG